MTNEEQKEYDDLEEEARKIHQYFVGFLSSISQKKLNRLIELEIELETYCNQ